MAKGQKVFTDEEINRVYPPFKGFFTNGETREIVVISKETIQATSQAGKPYVNVEWLLADAKTGERHLLRFDFSFTNAMHPFKESMRCETSVFKITPVKTGERTSSKGQTFDVFDYDIEYVGEDGNAPAPDTDKVEASSIPF